MLNESSPIIGKTIFFFTLICVYTLLWYASVIWSYNPFSSLWFAPTGMTVAMLILWKRSGFLLVWFSNFVMTVFVLYYTKNDYDLSYLITASAVEGLAHTAPYWLAISLSERFERQLDSISDGEISKPTMFITLLIFASFFAALLGISARVYFEKMTIDTAKDLFLPSWTGDLVGAIILAPLFIIFFHKFFDKIINPRQTILYILSTNTKYIPKSGIIVLMLAFVTFILPFITYIKFEFDDRVPLTSAFFIILGPIVYLANRSCWGALVISNVLASMLVILVIRLHEANADAITYQSALLAMAIASIFFASYFRTWKINAELFLKSEKVLAKASNLLLVNEMGTTISHELNSPMQAALTFTQLSIRKLNKKNYVVEDITKNLEQVADSIESVSLVLSQIRSININNNHELHACSSDETTRFVLKFLQPELLRHSINIDFSYESFLPLVAIKKTELVQVITNLIRNSIDELRDKEIRYINIVIKTDDDEFLYISISDTGNGIELDKRKALFDLSESTKEGGMGVGLWLSHSIIWRVGGELSYVDKADAGACFIIKLPTNGGGYSD